MQASERVRAALDSLAPSPEKVTLAVKAAVEVAQPSRVFVFGSWARGEARPDSDLDLAILLPEQRLHEIPELRRQIRRKIEPISISVDLVLVTEEYFSRFLTSINSIYYKIAHEGRLVYEQGR